jgi:hypothetical protein
MLKEVKTGDRFTSKYVEVVEPIDGVDDGYVCRDSIDNYRIEVPIEELRRRELVVNTERGTHGDIVIRGHEYESMCEEINSLLNNKDVNPEVAELLHRILGVGGTKDGT